jgi:hypothetical protein
LLVSRARSDDPRRDLLREPGQAARRRQADGIVDELCSHPLARVEHGHWRCSAKADVSVASAGAEIGEASRIVLA